jgi:hypothetical protein
MRPYRLSKIRGLLRDRGLTDLVVQPERETSCQFGLTRRPLSA